MMIRVGTVKMIITITLIIIIIIIIRL